jgi:hypothetical protein
MLILVLCKQEIRLNKRQFDVFIRANIDAKIFDLPYKCNGFEWFVDQNGKLFKGFKKVVDKRNNAIHGNVDPEKEMLETVYFEQTRPLFERAGDSIGTFMSALERQFAPETALRDYENVHMFLAEIVECLEPHARQKISIIMENAYPGYEVNQHRVGVLFSDTVFSAYLQGMRYDDELKTQHS